MAEPIHFYFDFSSPYGYLASEVIDDMAAAFKREVVWRPYLLGVIYKINGMAPLTDIPIKSAYSRHDFDRTARLLKIPFQLPRQFPFLAVPASRAYYWIAPTNAERARDFARAVFRKAFRENDPPMTAEAVADIGESMGVDRDGLLKAIQGQEMRAKLKKEVDAAIKAGVFGSPYFIVDGEPFWGCDRLGHLRHWLETGGW